MPVEVLREWQRSLVAQDYDAMRRVVDFDAYTENCLGLTGWTTGYEVALGNYVKNMMTPWADITAQVEEIVVGENAVTVRLRQEGTHVGAFLGIPLTHRRISWDSISIVQVREDRVVGQ